MRRMKACITEIQLWMDDNFLKLNDAKTEFIMFGTPNDLKRVSEWTASVGTEEVFPSMIVRNIGAMMDSVLSMESHISNVRKSCYLQIQNLSKLRNYLSEEAAKSLTHAFVTSRLDNMNSLLHYLPNYQTEKPTYSK